MPEAAAAPVSSAPTSLTLDQGVDQLFAALSGSAPAAAPYNPSTPVPPAGPVPFDGVAQTLPAQPTQDYGTDPGLADLWKKPADPNAAPVPADKPKDGEITPPTAPEDLIEFEGPDGKPVQLTLQDAIQAHTEVSTLRRELEQVKQQSNTMPEEIEQALLTIHQARAQLVREHQQIRSFIRPQPPNQELLNESGPRYNPRLYAQQLQDYNNSSQWLQQQEQAIQKQQQELAAEQQALREADMARGKAKLRQMWPEVFTDQATRSGLVDVLKTAGYDPQTALNTVTDVRAYQVLRLALKGLQAERAASGALKRVTSAPQLIRAAERTNATQAIRSGQLARLKQTGNVDDALAIPGIIEMLTR